ncbi:hypothetical protein EDB85DRAFT_1565686 [Lactarius pseudohatsudake]|nr:hypothetical protein EDB85DRAFT_1565686 [Lactarius pseudohatsudake]
MVATRTVKQHDSDLRHGSRRRAPPVFHENDDPARKSTDNDVEMRDTDLESQHPPAPAGASRRSTSSQSRVPSCRMSKTPLFLPSPPHPPLPPANVTETRTMTRWTSYTSIPLSPLHGHLLLGAARARPRNEGTGAADGVLVPPLPSGVRKSDCMPVKQRYRTRQRQTAAKWNAQAGDNSGSMELVHVYGLLATYPAAEPPPASDNGACATTANSAPASSTDPDPDDLQDATLDLDIDLDISNDLEAGPTDAAHGVGDDVVPVSPPQTGPARLCDTRA